ncbi:type II toxin-antitoxin system RelB/DinJ family antitoxin [Ligilactobacillus sp. LYQ135]
MVGRVDKKTKKQGEIVLRKLGLTSSEYIYMCYRYLVNQKGLPFNNQKID